MRAYNYILSDVTIFTNDAVGHDVAEVPDFGAGAYLAVVVDDGGGVGEVVCLHWRLAFEVWRLGFDVWGSTFGVYSSLNLYPLNVDVFKYDIKLLVFFDILSVCSSN